MKTEEKLNHFYDAAIAEATRQSDSILKDYEISLNKIAGEQIKLARRKAHNSITAAKANLELEKNKSISHASMKARQKVNDLTVSLKDQIFDQVEAKLQAFKQTGEYPALLIKEIEKAVAFAGDNPITIYIDESDSRLKAQVEKSSRTQLAISEDSFLGGIRAIIPSKNILIDESFSSKLEELKETYQL